MSETLIWFIAAVVSFVIEILAPLGAFLFVGLGCLAASLASFAGLDSAWQFTAAGVFAVLTALLFRRKLKRIFSGRKATSEELEHQMSGQEGRAATELVPGEEGQVEVCGSFWRARLEGQASAPKGARIVVVSSAPGDAMLLLVRPK
ncbi:MAG: NfeD family protein [Desulfovibrio sp.]|jgi:membrane protein implicated in regulation of membrane protease activity|nr:NfeD family protein [Desulfovibrio sp.]MBQ2516129.1 NfeD family protein [Desulfovibrio sp.]MBQ4124996.1 NfeD family protein [Desulfovibrio sp.]